MKQICCFIIALVMPLLSFAQKEFIADGLKFKILDEASVAVSKISDNNNPSGVLNIPSKVNFDGKNYTVTTLPGWSFFGCKELTEVIIPGSVTKVDIWSFSSCPKLEKVTFDGDDVEIGYAVFNDCENLTNIRLPANLQNIDERFFDKCSRLASVEIPTSVKSIGMSAFSSCKSLKSIELPEGVTELGKYAFAYCDSLEHIGMPKQLKSIGSDAFSGCRALKHLDIPEGVTSLGGNAFNFCRALESISLPASLTTIVGNPFSECAALKDITISPNNTAFTIVNGILYSKDMTELFTCPTSLEIGDFVVPTSVKRISNFAFYGCKYLTSLKLNNVTYVGASTFSDCANLTSVDFGTKFEVASSKAFYNCKGLTEIKLPNSVVALGQNAFGFCSELKQVSVSEKLAGNKEGFNNEVFLFCPDDITFIVRKTKGGTRTLKYSDLPVIERINR